MTDKFKIGILDLLTILLPGAFLLLLLSHPLQQVVNAVAGAKDLLAKEWIFTSAFLGGAYVLGHFVFFIAASLDDLVYDKIKKVYWHDTAKLTAYVLQIKQEKTGISDPKVLNAFKWSAGYLMAKQPTIYAEVERYMAESKFFRSLVIVLLIATVIFLLRQQPAIGPGVGLPMIVLSLVRYLTQRQKAIVTAYQGIIITHKGKLPAQPNPDILFVLQRELLSPTHPAAIGRQSPKQPANNGGRKGSLQQSLRKLSFAVRVCLSPDFERNAKNVAKQEAHV